jgi:hypothetical protein
MPDETLLNSLQALRDEYAQRTKAAKKVLTVLKGKTSAFGKIQQALGEFEAVNNGADLSALGQVQDAFTAAQAPIAGLTAGTGRDEKLFTKLVSALKGIQAALETTPVDINKLSQQYAVLKALDVQDERLLRLQPVLDRALDAAQQSLGLVFGNVLRDAFAASGLAVTGSPPNFEVGRFEIAANFLSRRATISYGKEPVVARVALSTEAVMKAYQTAAKQVQGRAENAELWMSQFFAAWEAARRKRDTANVRANIIECYFEMVLLRQSKSFFTSPSKQSFADYTRAQFAHDLFEIAVRPQRAYKGLVVFAHVATKSQTDASTRSLWMVEGRGPHDGRYIGDIVFDKNE